MSIKQKISYATFKQAKVKWSGLGGDIIDVKPDKVKSKPKPYVEAQWLTDYKRERDRLIWKDHLGSREEIELHYKTK